MNIFEAAKLLKDGKNIRRSSWEPEEYVNELAGMITVYKNFKYYKLGNGKKFDPTDLETCLGEDSLGLEELLAEDWELVIDE